MTPASHEQPPGTAARRNPGGYAPPRSSQPARNYLVNLPDAGRVARGMHAPIVHGSPRERTLPVTAGSARRQQQ